MNSSIPALKLNSCNNFTEEVEHSDKYNKSYVKYLDDMWEMITKEITYLVYIGGFSSSDVLRMSPHERRFHYNFISGARKEEQERLKQLRQNT